ncbi:MAG: Crp/Fnr family transcriptional regulator [Lentimicrobiaceae bacterium]|nr:Crp/Fnr family transcriptional regulator [Lentimicrobiaceae bacterium]
MSVSGADTCVSFVYEVSCFDLLSAEEKQMIDSTSVLVNYKKGETICKQGSFASHIMYVEKGLVKVYLEGSAKNLILTITPKFNLLGLQALFEGNNTFLYSISTYTESSVRLIDVQVFKQLLRQNPAFGYRVINILNESTSQSYGRFFSLTQKQLHGRLADILLCLSRRIFKSDSFDLPLSRSDLSDLTSMSTESVIRIMKDFKDDNIIEINNKSITLIDIPRLERISEKG